MFQIKEQEDLLFLIDPTYEFWQPTHNSCISSLTHTHYKYGFYLPTVKISEVSTMLDAVGQYRTAKYLTAAEALGDQGRAFAGQKEFEKAIELFQRARTILQKQGDDQGVLQLLQEIAEAYTRSPDLPKAIESWEESLRILRRRGVYETAPQVPGILENLAIVYGSIKEYAEVVECYSEIVRLLRKTGNQSELAKYLKAKGQAHQSRAQYQMAIDSYKEALPILRETGKLRQEAYVLGNMGVAYAVLGDVPRAIEQLTQSRVVFVDRLGATFPFESALTTLHEKQKQMGNPRLEVESDPR